MKKNLLLVRLLSFVFLGLGSVSLGYSQGCVTEQNNSSNAAGPLKTCLDGCTQEELNHETPTSDCETTPKCIQEQENKDIADADLTACQNATTTPAGGSNNQTSSCSSFGSCGGDANCLALQKNLCEGECKGTWNGTTCNVPPSTADPNQFNAACGVTTITSQNVGYVEDLGNGQCCLSADGIGKVAGLTGCTTAQTIAAGSSVPCNVTTSSLNGVPHAFVSSIGISCSCEKGRGEYYDTQAGKTLCGECTRDDVCCGTKLNTKIPFIGDCIESSTQASGSAITETTAFPILVTALVKILISVILVASFILIIVAGVMIATGDAKGGKDMIIKVAIGLAILGASGVILRLINPNFFG